MGQCVLCWFFFFQAEDGIRDLTVTGVQTCALPIYSGTENAKTNAKRRGMRFNALEFTRAAMVLPIVATSPRKIVMKTSAASLPPLKANAIIRTTARTIAPMVSFQLTPFFFDLHFGIRCNSASIGDSINAARFRPFER